MTVTDKDPFDQGAPRLQGATVTGGQLMLNLEGFEGPLDLLLTLARVQKVDLAQISILELVEQYLGFISELRKLRIELAADYLVMAAWLAYLKSRLLLPQQEGDEEPSAEEMANRLQLQLQRLDAMREAGARLMSRERLGREVFSRGDPEHVVIHRRAGYDVSLYQLLKVYGEISARTSTEHMHIAVRPVYSLEDAIHRLGKLIGETSKWVNIREYLPSINQSTDQAAGYKKSEVASMFAASLELARTGEAEIRQLETYGPLFIRRHSEKRRQEAD